MAADTVYLKIEQNVLVREPSVTLKDIAKITSTNRLLVNKLKQIKIYTFHTPANKSRKKKQVEVFSVLKIIELPSFPPSPTQTPAYGLLPPMAHNSLPEPHLQPLASAFPLPESPLSRYLAAAHNLHSKKFPLPG